MNIHEFTATINEGAFAKASHFEVFVIGPIRGVGISDVSSVLPFRCSAATFPGRDLTTTAYRTYGPIQKVVNDASYSDINLTFTLSDAMDEKLFFERWQDIAAGAARGMTTKGPDMYDIGYYDDYIGTIVLRQFDEMGQITYECELVEAYPIRVAELVGDWGTGDPHKLNVSIAYRYFIDDPEYNNAVLLAAENAAAEAALAQQAIKGFAATGAGSSEIGIDPGADLKGVAPNGAGGAPGELERIIVSPTKEVNA